MRRIVFAAALLAFATPTFAVDFNTQIMEINGKTPMVNKDGSPFTLADAAEQALLAVYQSEPNIEGKEKAHRFDLATKIEHQKKDPPLGVEDIALIKKLIGIGYPPLITGQAFLLLDPQTKVPEPAK